MAAQAGAEDPLVSALPPATDYMTYLTLLEYQLTPRNLPTLSRLLSDDDGKLAEEIGWDLLKLILPMLKDTPEEANRCLEIVARRGNPREVVVRVAEELEKLSDEVQGSENEDDFDERDDQDDLPTFPGEAPRVHLGQMTLQGMPADMPSHEGAGESGNVQETVSDKALKLQALFNMLSILHPRIKTQFPSRFLATSLPAALGAYRQVPISTVTTSSFLTMLEKIAGRKRPPLPPRTSTQGEGPSSSKVPQDVPASTAPLPDPEAKAEEEDTGVNEPSQGEKAIIFRLLDAVLLEVLDEYMSSLATHDHPSMSWTARLREYCEPRRVVPGRPTENAVWEKTPELKERDALLARFFSISKQMQLDANQEITKLVHEDEDEDLENPYHDETPSEYPTKPSQIPFPRAGVIFLHAYQSYINPSDTEPLLTTSELTKLIAHSFPLSATPTIPLPPLQDSLLSLLYKRSLAVTAAPTTPQPSPAKFLLLISTLTQLFTITPYPSLRDSAHYIATKLIHAYPDPSLRLQVIAQTLRGDTLSTNWAEIEDELEETEPPAPGIDEETGLTRSTSALQPHPIPLAPPQQLGLLKAVGVDWLKAEFSEWISAGARAQAEEVPMVIGALDPSAILFAPNDADRKEETSEDKNDTDRSLIDLLFPPDMPSLALFSSSSTTTSTSPEESPLDKLPDLLLSIPFYISTLNLICIVLPHLPFSQHPSSSLKSRISAHLSYLNNAVNLLLELLQHAQASTSSTASGEPGMRGGGADEHEGFLEESRADIYAFQDACVRATGVWEKVA
ncbi:uncharacterized protein Z520_01890 [Fonsecaea multimorphosa CBS 102226]|uniref:Uncharacterized protein n=1 Tax=Fonsecaea multimorphosa CBS 102226 TaxID=1442371 RepID=A0A0D2IXH8_9EURO|nr:uncharacterized protein Z520_01890 [Fonsecaea multimorphosa CBS 102226]KIY01752.1 hypothetical protein Z520_01890 [Fonsecaea multimorphosa CBS 102226]OAL29946.1 hypothetical protein AYO22_01852 [Fonsecaea multimorphosa]